MTYICAKENSDSKVNNEQTEDEDLPPGPQGREFIGHSGDNGFSPAKLQQIVGFE